MPLEDDLIDLNEISGLDDDFIGLSPDRPSAMESDDDFLWSASLDELRTTPERESLARKKDDDARAAAVVPVQPRRATLTGTPTSVAALLLTPKPGTRGLAALKTPNPIGSRSIEPSPFSKIPVRTPRSTAARPPPGSATKTPLRALALTPAARKPTARASPAAAPVPKKGSEASTKAEATAAGENGGENRLPPTHLRAPQVLAPSRLSRRR